MATKRKAKKEKHATPLEPEKVEAAIEKLTPAMRKKMKSHYERKLPDGKPMVLRHGSPAEARKLVRKGRPELAVTEQERKDMAEAYAKGGMSYREVEATFHLKAANGNDAYRQINNVCAEDEKVREMVRKECKRTGQPIPEKAKTEKDRKKAHV